MFVSSRGQGSKVINLLNVLIYTCLYTNLGLYIILFVIVLCQFICAINAFNIRHCVEFCSNFNYANKTLSFVLLLLHQLTLHLLRFFLVNACCTFSIFSSSSVRITKQKWTFNRKTGALNRWIQKRDKRVTRILGKLEKNTTQKAFILIFYYCPWLSF